jgi:predicted RNase H-like nuclease (RuvC/YqgF family)
MDSNLLTAIIGFAGVVLGILFNSAIQYFKAKTEAKKTETDIASEIINQYKGLFEPYKEEVVTLREINKELKKDNAEFKQINENLKRDNAEFEKIVADLKIALDECNECVRKMKKEDNNVSN